MKIYATVIMIVFCLVARSQSDTTGKKVFKAGLQFISNQSYLGRTDSLKLPVIIPYVNFSIAKGFYLKASGYVNLSTNNQGFDGGSIEGGWEFSKNNLNGSISIAKYFISDSSNLIIAPVKTSTEFYLGYESKIVTPFFGAGYLFNNQGNDYFVYGGISRAITVTRDAVAPSVTLEPSLSLSGGTQQFYYSFLKTYAGNGKGKGRGRGSSPIPVSQTVEQESKRFALLSASFEMPITITKNKIECKFSPALESPLNLVDNNGAGAQSSKSYFYITVEVNYSF